MTEGKPGGAGEDANSIRIRKRIAQFDRDGIKKLCGLCGDCVICRFISPHPPPSATLAALMLVKAGNNTPSEE